MKPQEGDKLRSKLTGTVFIIKGFKGGLAILETKDGQTQVLTEKANLKLFYDKIEMNKV